MSAAGCSSTPTRACIMIAHMSPGSLEPILLISVVINLQQLQAEGQSLGQRLSQSVMRGPARHICPRYVPIRED